MTRRPDELGRMAQHFEALKPPPSRVQRDLSTRRAVLLVVCMLGGVALGYLWNDVDTPPPATEEVR